MPHAMRVLFCHPVPHKALGSHWLVLNHLGNARPILNTNQADSSTTGVLCPRNRSPEARHPPPLLMRCNQHTALVRPGADVSPINNCHRRLGSACGHSRWHIWPVPARTIVELQVLPASRKGPISQRKPQSAGNSSASSRTSRVWQLTPLPVPDAPSCPDIARPLPVLLPSSLHTLTCCCCCWSRLCCCWHCAPTPCFNQPVFCSSLAKPPLQMLAGRPHRCLPC